MFIEETRREFAKHFPEGKQPVYSQAPGRTNLIGEHVDYQGGYVLPVAVNRWIEACGVRRGDSSLRLFSVTYKQLFTGSLGELQFQTAYPWANYVLGVTDQLKKAGIVSFGFDLAVGGNIPVASGLSSSAALEICIACLLLKLAEKQLPQLEVIKLARRAENEFVGVNCGIMDQFSSYLCRAHHALLLNCATLEYQHVPLNLGSYCLLLVDTLKERKLSASHYNERVRQVKEALSVVRRRRPEVEYLTQLQEQELEEFSSLMEPVVFQRALHVIRENQRVRKAVKLLQEGDVFSFGKLLYASHESLRDLYQVSCEELDFIVEQAAKDSEVAGARLTGAGFGGCCLVLLKETGKQDFKDKLLCAYRSRFNKQPRFYEVETTDGAYYLNRF